MPFSRSMRAAVVALPLSLFASSTFAASYALSVNEITQFKMAFPTGSATFDGFTFANDSAATEDGGTGGTDGMDAQGACTGDCVGWDNEFYGHATTSEFSYGDAQITNADVLAGTGAASTIGEVNVIDGTGYAAGSNVMVSTYFMINDPNTTISFSFQADPLLSTVLGGNGLTTAANINFGITLKDAGNNPVFEWAPDGNSGSGITGGTEHKDPFSLNSGITGTSDYDPLQGLFEATTGSLSEGSYNLNISMSSQVNAAVVPVPAAVWLFGSGLLGLIGVARRRQS